MNHEGEQRLLPFSSAPVQLSDLRLPRSFFCGEMTEMRMPALFALAMLVSAGAAQAQSMPVSDFLAKAEALQSKGAMALFSSDVGLLKTEIQNSGKQLRAEEAAIRRAGNKPAFCMPAKASTDSRELLEHFRSIPLQQRGMTVKTAFAGLMRNKYPCPA